MLWWLLAGTKGGINRAHIIKALKDRPFNANQLAELLKLDYKTIRHHLKVLQDNRVIVTQGEGYSMMYFLSREFEDNYVTFEEIWNKIEKKGGEV